MFDIKAKMKKNGITQEYVAETLGRSKSDIRQIVNSNNNHLKLSLWKDIMRFEFDKELFEKLDKFYSDFFFNKTELEIFISEKLSYKKSNIPRRMINNVERLITLSDDIEKIRKEKDCLKLFFTVVCIETLYKLAKSNLSKVKMVIDFYESYISKDDQNYILSKFKRSYGDACYQPGEFDENIDMEIFARIIYEIRSYFVHEGDYYNFSFASGELPMMNHIFVKERDGERKEERVYDVKLKYTEFRNITVRGLISFIDQYF